MNHAAAGNQAQLGLARCYERIGESQAAESQYIEAARTSPNDLRISTAYTMFLYRFGRFEEARISYAKFEASRSAGRALTQWDGVTVRDKSFLIMSRVGYGDIIHFMRIASWLRQQGVQRVVVVAQHPLRALLSHADGVDEAMLHYEVYPPTEIGRAHV